MQCSKEQPSLSTPSPCAYKLNRINCFLLKPYLFFMFGINTGTGYVLIFVKNTVHIMLLNITFSNHIRPHVCSWALSSSTCLFNYLRCLMIYITDLKRKQCISTIGYSPTILIMKIIKKYILLV